MKKLFNKYLPLAYGIYFNKIVAHSKEKAAKKAFNLFSRPKKGQVLSGQKAYLDNAKNGALKSNGAILQVYKWPGKKDTVLLVHGWESNSFRWRNLIAKLQEEGYTIIAFDAPAHGNSTGDNLNAPMYAECIQEVIKKYKPQHVIGHSVGGMAILYSQYKYPDANIKKIVTIGSPSEFEEIMAYFQQLLRFNDKVLNALDDYVLKRFGFRIKDFSTSQFVKTNTKKGLLVHDELDTVAPCHASEKVHDNWKGSIFIKTKGLGHSLHQDKVNAQIVDFLKS